MTSDVQLSTGVPGLDRLLRGLIPGDNLVWQVDEIEHFAPFVPPYCRHALARGKRIVYFRFAEHPPLVPAELPTTICQLDTARGFEQLITEIHRVLSESGREACFVFDCLSMLADAWLSDRMLGNFFRLTCPYVLDLESLAYFPILRNRHSFHAVTPIRNTTQIFLDVYRHREELYVHPIKVEHRYSPTMHMLHGWEGDELVPLVESSTTAEILTSIPWTGLDTVRMRQGVWTRSLARAEQIWEETQAGVRPAEDAEECLDRLLQMIVTRDARVLELAKRHFDLGDVLQISRRMIGTGLIGGKSVGMLLARAILSRADARWPDLLEAHDSFYVGSDVFYSYLVENGCWWFRQKQRDPATFLEGVEETRRRILTGAFPEYIQTEFAEMLEYFGQSPIIVRSSSLLEDNYGNAFAGKYESIFCANQGPHQKRLADFLAAVRAIYASTMSENALRYRAQRGLLEHDEQMSLLVQRVSGSRWGTWFFPQVAGVGYSFNPYVWSHYIDPKAGMVRLVFGLGTRAVDRSDDDYTRVVALNDPQRRPESGTHQVRQFSQRRVDVIDLEASRLASLDFTDVCRQCDSLPLEKFASQDRDLAAWAAEQHLDERSSLVLTFDELLTRTPFVGDMQEILATLQHAYGSPVDLEFTTNFFAKDDYKVNLVQCRPLQIATGSVAADRPEGVAPTDIIIESAGAVIGPSRLSTIERVVYVEPLLYGQLPIADRYALARVIGRLIHLPERKPPGSIMLIGPGRWCTNSPSLGVPVSFSEIDRVSVICEIVAMRDDLVPDVSLGTHFFNDLVELDILYFALFPGRPQNHCHREFFLQSPNRLAELLPDAARWSPLLRVLDFSLGNGQSCGVRLYANTPEQLVLCYRTSPEQSPPK
ncbi:MAG: PEP/pyruvate-binding domain-containing protein [Pirellulaceae bacterium]